MSDNSKTRLLAEIDGKLHELLPSSACNRQNCALYCQSCENVYDYKNAPCMRLHDSCKCLPGMFRFGKAEDGTHGMLSALRRMNAELRRKMRKASSQSSKDDDASMAVRLRKMIIMHCLMDCPDSNHDHDATNCISKNECYLRDWYNESFKESGKEKK